MPASVIGEVIEAIVKTVFEAVAEFVGYYTAVILVPPLSLGTLDVEPFSKISSRKERWHGCYRDEKGKMVLGHQLASFLGIVFWVLMALMAYVVF